MRNFSKRLGRKLRSLRGDAPLRDFARKLGVSHTTLNRMEMGKQNVTIASLEKICNRLKCDIGDLFSEPQPSRDDEV